jgi:hypothetical protein
MMISNKFNRIIFLLLFLAGITACNKDDNTEMEKVQFQINFTHTIGDDELEFDTIRYTSALGNNYSVSTLKYFISDFAFINEAGFIIRVNQEHYVDATDESTLTFNLVNKVPTGNYSAITFIFGLSKEKNITDRYLDPPENSMEWPIPMGGGYHYMKLEGKFNDNNTIKNYQCHTGPTMGNPNFIMITIPASSFNASGTQMTFNINMNINKWFETPNNLDLNDVTGIMGNQEMQLKLKANGANAFSLESIE